MVNWSNLWKDAGEGIEKVAPLALAAVNPMSGPVGLASMLMSGDSGKGGNTATASTSINIVASMINSSIVNQSTNAGSTNQGTSSILANDIKAASLCIDNSAQIQVLTTAKAVEISEQQLKQQNSFAATLTQAAESLSKGPPVGNKSTSIDETGMKLMVSNNNITTQVQTCTNEQKVQSNIRVEHVDTTQDVRIVNQPNLYTNLLATCNLSTASSVTQTNSADITIHQTAKAKAIGASQLGNIVNIFMIIIVVMILVAIVFALAHTLMFITLLFLGFFVVAYIVIYTILYGTLIDESDGGEPFLVQFIFDLLGIGWPDKVLKDFGHEEPDVRSSFSTKFQDARKERDDYHTEKLVLSRPFINRMPLQYTDNQYDTQSLASSQARMSGFEPWQPVTEAQLGQYFISSTGSTVSYWTALQYAREVTDQPKGDDQNNVYAFTFVRNKQYERAALVSYAAAHPSSTGWWQRFLQDISSNDVFEFPNRNDADPLMCEGMGSANARADMMLKFRIIQMYSKLQDNQDVDQNQIQGTLYRARCLLPRACVTSNGGQVDVDGESVPQGYDGYNAGSSLNTAWQTSGGDVPPVDTDWATGIETMGQLYASCTKSYMCGLVPTVNTGTQDDGKRQRSGSSVPPGTGPNGPTATNAGWEMHAFPVSKSVTHGRFGSAVAPTGGNKSTFTVHEEDVLENGAAQNGAQGTCNVAVVLEDAVAYFPRVHDVAGDKEDATSATELHADIVRIYESTTHNTSAYPHGAGVVATVSYQSNSDGEPDAWYNGDNEDDEDAATSTGCKVYQIHNYEGFLWDTKSCMNADGSYNFDNDKWFRSDATGVAFASSDIDLLAVKSKYMAAMVTDKSQPAGRLNPNGVIGTPGGQQVRTAGATYRMAYNDLMDPWTPSWMIGGLNGDLALEDVPDDSPPGNYNFSIPDENGHVHDLYALYKPQLFANSVTWFGVRDARTYPQIPPSEPTGSGTSYGDVMNQKMVWISCEVLFMMFVSLVVTIIHAILIDYGMFLPEEMGEASFTDYLPQIIAIGSCAGSVAGLVYFFERWLALLTQINFDRLAS